MVVTGATNTGSEPLASTGASADVALGLMAIMAVAGVGCTLVRRRFE
jgi:LPXTG-motif cell wall-anchored protein